MPDLPPRPEASRIEPKWYAYWLEKGYFRAEPSRGGEPYCIVIPPPNVTGILHMGHALNNTIQDVLIRWRRMQGRNTLWVPGTDHAGIATQNVVERTLQREGKTRDDLGREAFLQRVWAWKEQYGRTIIQQLKRLGASCDWDRERFTMDEGLSRAVAEVFVRLYRKGLIYRGHYIINWCPRCRTALSDEESEHRERAGKLYYIRYPFSGGPAADGIRVATTRPETLLGDVAVAVNPKDERYRAFVGRIVRLPVLGREIPIIADDFVDPEFGTGCVKVTPAHDPNDFEIGRRHGLTPVNIMNDDGTLNENAGPYAGLDRFAARERLVRDLEAQGLLEKIEEHRHAVGHCYRCHTMVEPRLSTQWFVRMKPLAQPAIEVVRQGRIRFIPDRWTKVYLDWMENIRDWCISRQIWWGHRIPVFYCDVCGHTWAEVGQPAACPQCGASAIRQDPDVLDTWFSSWLWPFSVFGWPEQNRDLEFYYPTSTLVTASEILFFWVARMIMAGLEFMGEIPFSEVYIHGTVRDDTGRKMSKSLGNSIDPLAVIERYSADALRFSLIMLTATGQDVYLSDAKFEIGRNFATKIWNAARYLAMKGPEVPADFHAPDFGPGQLGADDQHILAKLHETIAACEQNLERYRLNDYARAVYDFMWHEFCDWYVEYSKDALAPSQGDGERREAVLKIMHYVFSTGLRLLHPVMPFVTEELWHALGYRSWCESVVIAPWPRVPQPAVVERWGLSAEAVAYVEAKHDLIRAARTLKADCGLAPKQKADFIVRPAGEREAAWLARDTASVTSLLQARVVTVDPQYHPPQALPSAITALGTVFLPIEGLVDAARECGRLRDQWEKARSELERLTKKLQNLDFVTKAPREVVAAHETRKKELLDRSEKLQRLIAIFSEMAGR